MSTNNLLSYEFAPKSRRETIALIHGFLGDSSHWDFCIETLKHNYQVLTIDLPGHGKNSSTDTYSIEDLALHFNEILLALNISRCHVVGHSMGGYLGCAFAKAYSSKLISLTLINSCASSDSMQRQAQRNRSLKLLQKHAQTFTSMAISNLFTAEEQKENQHFIHNMKRKAVNINSGSLENAIIAMRDRLSYVDDLKAEGFVTHYIYGNKDKIISPETNRFEHHQIAGSKAHQMDSGHMSLATHPRKIIELLPFVDLTV